MACNFYMEYLDVADSTSRYARDEAVRLWNEAAGKDFVAVVAEYQTAGRGQRGNCWQSQRGENLLLSIVARPGSRLEVSRQFLFSQAVALSLHSAMGRYGIDTRLKWPNDIYAGNRKLAGILMELDFSGRFVEQAVIGIGLNVNQVNFPEMDRVPVSMRMLLGSPFPVNEVMDRVLEAFEYYYGVMLADANAVAAEYKELLLGIGEQRMFVDSSGCFAAVIEGVEPGGHLQLRRSDGTLSRYAFKEVEMQL